LPYNPIELILCTSLRSVCLQAYQALPSRLQNQVIDIEVVASTPSPTVDPSVHVILLGHSMGGIVAAETLLGISNDAPIPAQTASSGSNTTQSSKSSTGRSPSSAPFPQTSELPALMFPHISGILAFDTPYLGISPGVIAHGAETHYRSASSAYTAISEVAGVFGLGAAAGSQASPSPQNQKDPQKLLTQGADAMTASMKNSSEDAAPAPSWQRWGKYAMFAGAAGAVAAGGTAAYLKRDKITEGWSFIGSHLEFVGCLAKGEELKTRLERTIALNKARDIGFADIVTLLGKNATPQKKEGTTVAGGFVEIGAVQGIAGPERTFCTIPKSEGNKKFFLKMRDDKSGDEMNAHMNMFERRTNTGYFALVEKAKGLIIGWVGKEDRGRWCRDSTPLAKRGMGIGIVDVELREEEVRSKGDGKDGGKKDAEAGKGRGFRGGGGTPAEQNPWA